MADALLRKLATQRQEEQLARGEATVSAETLTIPPADYPRLLKRAYDNEQFAKPKNAAGVVTDLPVAEMEKQILAHIVVSPDELRELGERRAGTAKEALVKAGVAGARMFIVAAAAEAAAETSDSPRLIEQCPARAETDRDCPVAAAASSDQARFAIRPAGLDPRDRRAGAGPGSDAPPTPSVVHAARR